MKKNINLRCLFACALLLFVALGVFGQSNPSQMSITYLAGKVEYRASEEDSWERLSTNSTVQVKYYLRLHPGSSIELLSAGTRYTFRLPGTFNIAAVLQREAVTASLSAGRGIPGALPFDTSLRQRTTSAGVRASEALDPSAIPNPTAVTPRSLIDAGLQSLGEGLYTEALAHFSEAFDFAIDTREVWEALYYTGYTYLVQGRSAEAADTFDLLRNFEQPTGPDAEARYAIPFTLSYAQALLETGQNQAALDEIATFNPQAASIEQRQFERYFSGLALGALGNSAAASTALLEAAELDAASWIGQQAQNLVENFYK